MSAATATAHERDVAPPPLNPPERLLMGPGPSNPDPRVLAAMGANPVGHLDPYFVELMDQTMVALRNVYRTTGVTEPCFCASEFVLIHEVSDYPGGARNSQQAKDSEQIPRPEASG